MSPKVLILHVPYQVKGGEDVYVSMLCSAYENLGFSVSLYPIKRTLEPPSLKRGIYSLIPSASFSELDNVIKSQKPDFFHIQNIFPSFGVRFLHWLREQGVPVLMTVPNHRFYCTNGIAFRNNQVCKQCRGSVSLWRPILYNCNSDITKSVYYSLAVTQLSSHRLLERTVSFFLACSPYIAQELIEAGISSEKVRTLLNPTMLSGNDYDEQQNSYEYDILFVGRLSEEKGIRRLIKIIPQMSDVRFAIAGPGPLSDFVIKKSQIISNLTFLGDLSRQEVSRCLQKSRISILPSLCPEVCPLFVLESFYSGRRCIVPQGSSMDWFQKEGYPVVAVDMSTERNFIEGVRKAMKQEPLSKESISEVRGKVSLKRFQDDLREIVRSIC